MHIIERNRVLYMVPKMDSTKLERLDIVLENKSKNTWISVLATTSSNTAIRILIPHPQNVSKYVFLHHWLNAATFPALQTQIQ